MLIDNLDLYKNEKMNNNHFNSQQTTSDMKVGIISDTHDDIDNTNKAIDIFEKHEVQAIIHAGDIISPPIIKEFKRLTQKNVKVYGILGNNDGEKRGLESAFSFINGEFLGESGKINLGGLKFGVYHGTDLKKKEKMIKSGQFDVFIYGHTHKRDPEDNILNTIGNTIVFNPGCAHSSAKTNYSDPPYFRNPSILIFDTATKEFNFLNL